MPPRIYFISLEESTLLLDVSGLSIATLAQDAAVAVQLRQLLLMSQEQVPIASDVVPVAGGVPVASSTAESL